jgi:hypothetical protein
VVRPGDGDQTPVSDTSVASRGSASAFSHTRVVRPSRWIRSASRLSTSNARSYRASLQSVSPRPSEVLSFVRARSSNRASPGSARFWASGVSSRPGGRPSIALLSSRISSSVARPSLRPPETGDGPYPGAFSRVASKRTRPSSVTATTSRLWPEAETSETHSESARSAPPGTILGAAPSRSSRKRIARSADVSWLSSRRSNHDALAWIVVVRPLAVNASSLADIITLSSLESSVTRRGSNARKAARTAAISSAVARPACWTSPAACGWPAGRTAGARSCQYSTDAEPSRWSTIDSPRGPFHTNCSRISSKSERSWASATGVAATTSTRASAWRMAVSLFPPSTIARPVPRAPPARARRPLSLAFIVRA